jgi:hypothetical protein
MHFLHGHDGTISQGHVLVGDRGDELAAHPGNNFFREHAPRFDRHRREAFGKRHSLGCRCPRERTKQRQHRVEILRRQLQDGVSRILAGPCAPELRSLEMVEQKLSRGRCRHRDANIGDALGGGRVG